MIQLSLADINQKSPYQVVKAPNGDFFFATSLDIHYLISFEEEEPLGQCDTYQFVIQKLDMQRSPHDPKVEQTILAIINQFFIEHLNVLLYMCDDSDGREANRNRLFLSWFQKHAEPYTSIFFIPLDVYARMGVPFTCGVLSSSVVSTTKGASLSVAVRS